MTREEIKKKLLKINLIRLPMMAASLICVTLIYNTQHKALAIFFAVASLLIIVGSFIFIQSHFLKRNMLQKMQKNELDRLCAIIDSEAELELESMITDIKKAGYKKAQERERIEEIKREMDKKVHSQKIREAGPIIDKYAEVFTELKIKP